MKVLLAVLCLGLVSWIGGVPLVVNTDKGPVQGFEEGNIVTFLGIPYAQPPVGELRWRSPIPASPWTSPRDATKFGAACIQVPSNGFTFPSDVVYSEDCLFINVWAPNSTGAKPVFLWIHGGGLLQGGNSELRLRGETMASSGVVVVNINYRLGTLGWMAHTAFAQDDPNRPGIGNYGFLDQIQALNWVQKNIAAFGGDPNAVTISGESAGGASVLWHLISPLSKGLYSQVVVESAPPFVETNTLMDAQTKANKFQITMNCNSNVKECLRGLTPSQILSYPQQGDFGAIVINNLEFMEHPFASLVNKRVNPITAIVSGNVRDEGTGFVPLSRPASHNAYQSFVYTLFSNFAPLLLQNYPCERYNSSDCWYAAVDLMGDFSIICPTMILSNAYVGMVPSWTYVFSHAPFWGNMSLPPDFGAFHASEIPFVYSTLASIYPHTGEEVLLSKQMTQYWVNFTKYSNPNGQGVMSWPKYTGIGGTRFNFMTGGTPPLKGYKDDDCAFLISTVYSAMYN